MGPRTPLGSRWRTALAAALLLASLALPKLAFAQAGTGVIRVATTGTDANGCGSVAAPCQTLQYAVDQLPFPGGSGTVLVAGGTYTSSDPNRVVRITRRQVLMRGGYDAAFSASDPVANPTTIDGENARKGLLVDCPVGFSDCALTLERVTITRGNAPPDTNVLDAFGGGLDAYLANVTLTDVFVTGNTAHGVASAAPGVPGSGGGGGLSFRSSTATLTRVVLDGNTAQGGDGSGGAWRGGLGVGGGIFSYQSTITMDHVTGTNNAALAGDAPLSGGVAAGQRADGLGGFWALIYGSATVAHSFVAHNRAHGGASNAAGGLGLGGGVFLQLVTSAAIDDTTLYDNTALGGAGNGNLGGGGAIFAEDTSLDVQRSQLLANLAQGVDATGFGGTGGGGGLYMNSVTAQDSTATVTNTVIARNTVVGGAGSPAGYAFGGGVFMQCPQSSCSTPVATVNSLVLTHATIADNSVSGGDYDQGSALYASRYTTVDSSFGILSGHTTAMRPGYYFGEAIMAVGATAFHHTLWYGNSVQVSTAFEGTFLDDDPHAGAPDYVDPLASPPNYRILADSAARDEAFTSVTALDVDGQSRPFPDPGAPDLGASEYHTAPEPGALLACVAAGSALGAIRRRRPRTVTRGL